MEQLSHFLKYTYKAILLLYKQNFISNSVKANDLVIKSINKEIMNKSANKEVSTLFDYPKFENSCQQGSSQQNNFINNFIDKIANKFISHIKYTNYKFIF